MVVFHSLSKRSSLPGLRVGFAAGDGRFLARFLELRNVAAPQVPVPAQRVAIAAYDERTPQFSAFGSDLGVFSYAWSAHALWLLGDPDAAVTRAE